MAGQEEQADLVNSVTEEEPEQEKEVAQTEPVTLDSQVSAGSARSADEVLEMSEDERTRGALANYGKLDKQVGLSWEKLDFAVQDKTQSNNQKLILSDISGFVEPGKVLCILGPVCIFTLTFL